MSSVNTRLPNFLNKWQQEINNIKNNNIEDVINFYKNFKLSEENSVYFKILRKNFEERFIKENIDINNL